MRDNLHTVQMYRSAIECKLPYVATQNTIEDNCCPSMYSSPFFLLPYIKFYKILGRSGDITQLVGCFPGVQKALYSINPQQHKRSVLQCLWCIAFIIALKRQRQKDHKWILDYSVLYGVEGQPGIHKTVSHNYNNANENTSNNTTCFIHWSSFNVIE